MLKKIFAAGVAFFMVTACHHGHDHQYYTDDKGELSEIIPGSQEDLTINVGDRVHFMKNHSSLSSDAQETLKKQVMWLQANPDVVVTIEGHCDERGTKAFNLALGERRAESIKKFMVAHGIDSTRVYTISFGKERPEFYGHNSTAWAKNRRAVTVVTD